MCYVFSYLLSRLIFVTIFSVSTNYLNLIEMDLMLIDIFSISPPPHGKDCFIGGNWYKSVNIDPQRKTQLFISLLVCKELNEIEPADCWEGKLKSVLLLGKWSHSQLIHGICCSTNCKNHRRASATPSFRCTGIPLCSWKRFCFSGTWFSNCLRETVLLIFWAIWWRASRFRSILIQLLPTNCDNWTLENPFFRILTFKLVIHLVGQTRCVFN